MAIFELGDGRPVVAQPMQPSGPSLAPDLDALAREHLAELVGARVLPVARRTGSDGLPHILAVDVVGQPVVVEAAEVLDGDALLRALRYAGRATGFTTRDLARHHPGGPEQFAREFVAFRDGAAVAELHRAERRAGTRLVILCAQVAEDVESVLDFLRDDPRREGGSVEVLQVGVLLGADGRRYLDVAPALTGRPARQQEPTHLRLVGAPEPAGAQVPAPRPHPAERERPATAPAPEPAQHLSAGQHVTAAPRPRSAPPDPAAALQRLARTLAAPTTLVWTRERRGQHFVATLRPDGSILLPDGRSFTDPDLAAAAVSGSEAADGWQAWRLDAGGARLAEACAATPGAPDRVG